MLECCNGIGCIKIIIIMLISQNYYSCLAVPVKTLPHNKLACTVNIKQKSQATDDVASQNENEFSGKNI